MHFHFHHDHDIAGCVDDHPDFTPGEQAILATLTRMEMRLMATVNDSLTAAIDVIGALEDKIDALVAAQPAPVDTSALDAKVADAKAKLAALDPAPAAPVVDPAPADVPASDVPAPADVPADAQPAADGTVPVQSVPSVPLA